ncbi:MAG: glutathione S-transferase family protein [Pseudomonadota bacterium]
MKLYSSSFSPYAARVRAQIRLKNLPIAIEAPPGGLRTAEYRAVNPTGKVPALLLDDGRVLPESVAILEYLEDLHVEPELRPRDPHQRGHMRALIQIADHVLGPATFPLFGALRGAPADPATARAHIESALTQVAAFAGDGRWLLGDELTLADLVLAPTIYYALALTRLTGAPLDLATQPRLARWWHAACEQPALRVTLDEVDVGFRGFAAGLGHEVARLDGVLDAHAPAAANVDAP